MRGIGKKRWDGEERGQGKRRTGGRGRVWAVLCSRGSCAVQEAFLWDEIVWSGRAGATVRDALASR